MFNGPDIPVNVRQRMINLMYLVFVALLALNISSDVLDGFEQVDHTLTISLNAIDKRNKILLEQLSAQDSETFLTLHQKTDSLCDFIEQLKNDIIYLASGKKAQPVVHYNKADTEAASNILFAPVRGKQNELSDLLSDYRDYLLEYIIQGIPEHNLLWGLELYMDDSSTGWNFRFLENTPAITAITLLTGMQYTVRMTEWQSLYKTFDENAFTLYNQLHPRIYPISRNVSYGNKLHGHISFSVPLDEAGYELYMNGEAIEHERFSRETGLPGRYQISEEVELRGPDGIGKLFPVTAEYYVTPDPVIVSYPAMNILYAGIENDIIIYVPGVMPDELNVELSEGELRRKENGRWCIIPPQGISRLTINITGNNSGVTFRSPYLFRVLSLPAPSAFISFGEDSGLELRKGGGFSRQEVRYMEGIKTYYEDGLLDVSFEVLGFQLIYYDSFGNRLSLMSEDHLFTEAQLNLMRNMDSGKRLHISHIRVMGDDKEEKEVASLEILIN